MSLFNTTSSGAGDADRSDALPESIGRELADLFRAWVPIMGSSPPESSEPGNPDSSAALAEMERGFASYFSVSSIGLCVLDTEFRYLAINQAMARMNGISAAEHLEKTVREMLGDFAEVVEPQFNQVLVTGQSLFNIEISFLLQNRSEAGHWIEHYVPIKNTAGHVVQIGVVALEITEQKRLEQSLQSVSKKLREEKSVCR